MGLRVRGRRKGGIGLRVRGRRRNDAVDRLRVGKLQTLLSCSPPTRWNQTM